MDGYELFDKLKQLKPDLPIIISSGYGDTEVKARLASKSIAGIVSKPYNRDKLRDVLKSVVEGLWSVLSLVAYFRNNFSFDSATFDTDDVSLFPANWTPSPAAAIKGY